MWNTVAFAKLDGTFIIFICKYLGSSFSNYKTLFIVFKAKMVMDY